MKTIILSVFSLLSVSLFAQSCELLENEEVYIIVKEMPLWENCKDQNCTNQNMHSFVNEHLAYPKEAILDSLQGMVVVSFIVCEDGLVTGVKAVKSTHEILSKEAIRVVSLFPPFTSGATKDGKVPVQLNLPIKFEL